MSSIFVIINEYEPKKGNPCSEIVGGETPEYYRTENAAWSALVDMAKEFGVHVGADDTDFSLPLDDDSHLDYDEYYIVELTEAKER